MSPINRFDQPAQAQFINTYVPIPFDDLNRAAASRQGRADQVAGSLDAAQVAASNLSYIPNSKDQLTVEGWQRGLSEFADEFIDKDLSDPEISRKLRSGVRQLVNPNEVKRIQASRAGYDEYRKEEVRLEASGRGTHPDLRQDFSNYDSLSESGIFTGLPREGQNWKKAGKEFFDDLDFNKTSTIDVGDGFKSLVHELTADQTRQHAINNAKAFAQTPTGREIIDVAKANNDERDGVDIVREWLVAESAEHTKLRQGQPYYADRGDNTKSPKVIKPKTPSTSNAGVVSKAGTQNSGRAIRKATPEVEDLIPELSLGKLDKAREVLEERAGSARRKNTKKYNDLIRAAKTTKEKDRLTEEREKEEDRITSSYKDIRKNRREQGKQLQFSGSPEEQQAALAKYDQFAGATGDYYNISELRNLPEKEQIEKINEYIKYRYQRKVNPEVYEFTSSGRPLDAKEVETQKKLFIDNALSRNRNTYDPVKSFDQQLGRVSKLMDDYPPSELKGTYTWSLIGETYDIPSSQMALSKQVDITGPQGQSIGTFYIAGSNEEIDASRFTNDLTSSIIYGDLPFGQKDIPLDETDDFGNQIVATIEWSTQESPDTPAIYLLTLNHPELEEPIFAHNASPKKAAEDLTFQLAQLIAAEEGQ